MDELHVAASAQPTSTAHPDEAGATGGMGHLNAFFLLTDRPETYNLPARPDPAREPGRRLRWPRD